MGGRRRTSSLPSSSTRPGTTSYGGSHGALAQTVARADWNEVARDWRAGTRWPGGRIQLDAAVASSNMAGHRIPHHPHPQRGTISSSLELWGGSAGRVSAVGSAAVTFYRVLGRRQKRQLLRPFTSGTLATLDPFLLYSATSCVGWGPRRKRGAALRRNFPEVQGEKIDRDLIRVQGEARSPVTYCGQQRRPGRVPG